MTSAEQAALAYCSVLFADLDDSLDGHEVTILTLPGPGVRWLRVGDPAAIASAVRKADSDPRTSAVYLSMGLARPGTPHVKPDGRTRRAEAADIDAIVGAWADIDVAGPGHTKADLPPTEADAIRILDACGLRPTMLWRTGGGLQALWRFAEPWQFSDPDDPDVDSSHVRAGAAEVLRNWSTTLAVHAHRLGRWQVDPVFDLARVLRPAGTTNRKIEGDHRRVEIIYADGPTYEPDDLLAHTAEQVVLDQFVGMTKRTDGKGTAALDLLAIWKTCTSRSYAERNYMPEWLELALDTGVLGQQDRLVKVFRHGHDSGDDSTTDASLARLCADLGLDERDAVEMIMCRRLTHKRKLDKVDPRQRRDYLITTVDKVFASAAASRARAGQGAAALAAQDAAAEIAPAADAPMPSAADRAANAATGMHGLGGVAVAELGEAARLTVPDNDADMPDPDSIPAAAPSAGHDETPADDSAIDDGGPDDPFDDGELDEYLSALDGGDGDDPENAATPAPAPVPDDEPAPDEPGELDPARVSDDLPSDELPAEVEAEAMAAGADPVGAPPVGDPPAPPAGADEPPPADQPGDEPAAESARPISGGARSTWGTRTQSQVTELDALSATMLGKAAAMVTIWRCQYRGRGAKQDRRLVLRIDPRFRWPGKPPEGYVPGLPLTTGWWPSATFDKLGGWIAALRRDCLLVTSPVKSDEFDARFGDTLVRLWEPDTSGGSLANVARDGMLSYLLDFPPMIEWSECAAQGMPLIVQDEPRWVLSSRFTVLVRWADFGRHVRTHFAVNVTPAVLAEMAEMAGAQVAETRGQTGRWRAVRRDYLGDEDWSAILHGAAIAEQQRGERHSMHVVPGGRSDDAGADPAPRQRGTGAS